MSGSGISWAICKSAPRSRQITMPATHHSVFTSRVPFLPPNQQCQSTAGTFTLSQKKTNCFFETRGRRPTLQSRLRYEPLWMIHRRNVCRVVVTFSSGSDDDMDDDDDDDSDEQLRQNNNNVAVGAGGRQRRQQHREKRISVDDSVSKKAGKCTTTQHYTVRTNERPFNGPFSGTTRVSQYQKGKNQSGFY